MCVKNRILLFFAGTLFVFAQSDHEGMVDMNVAAMSLMNYASGTSLNAPSARMPMRMLHYGSWNVDVMANAFLLDTQQSGPRGGDKFYSSNWGMITAGHRVGANGAFQADLMLSLEPGTVTNRRYPLLFQTGETAYGRPIVDGQHPHEFIMALGFHYIRSIGESTLFDVYFAPVGDPALGPVAFPHRVSAAELPQATISHHLMDSTHIANEVVTVGLLHRKFRIEASGFYGSEPNENRWNIDSGPINSWSGRVWYFPTRNWAAQFSMGRIAHPESLEPGDQVRTTASVQYVRNGWQSTIAWGRNHNTFTRRDTNGFLVESVLAFAGKNYVTGRAELADKDELFPNELFSNHDASFRVGAYTIGYTRDIGVFHHLRTGIGANLTAYSIPGAIQTAYGNNPLGVNVFLRFRID
jgi:hypothetical protein